MTLTELRYVVAVARERHFGRAAEACFVSQPTLSVAVRKLENELGVALFERSPSDVTVTEIGKRIVEQAQRVLEESAALKQLADQQKDQLSGPLRVGLIQTVGPYVLPYVVPRLRSLAPNMPLMIEEDYRGNLGERLKQGELDAIVVSLPFEQPGIITEPLYDEPFVVILPKGHHLTNKAELSPEELEKENILTMSAGHCVREQVIACVPEARSFTGHVGSKLQGGSLDALRQMVASGLGVSIVPITATTEQLPLSEFIETRPLKMQAPSRRIALASRKRFPRPKAIAMVRDAIFQSQLPGVVLRNKP